MATCPKCSMSPFSVNTLQLHLKFSHHNDESSDYYQCRQQGCHRDYQTWRLYRRHLTLDHCIPANFDETSSMNKKPKEGSSCIDDEMPSCFPPSPPDLGNESIEGDQFNDHMFKEKLRNKMLSFIGKIYSIPNIPRNFVQTMIDDVVELFQEVFSLFGLALNQESTSKESMSFSDLTKLVSSSFLSYNTEFKRFKLFSETGYFIKPISYTIYTVVDDKRKKGRMVKEQVARTGQYIPIKKVLYEFFRLPNVLEKTLLYVKSLEEEEGVISNFIQGALWKTKKELHFKDKIVLPLFVFHDAYEPNNVLGSHAGVHKLAGTYLTIPCLPAEYRSTLENMFLALLTHEADRHCENSTLCRNEAVFTILIDQINILQREGITFLDENGRQVTVYFALGLLLGDNEGLNSIQGYVKSFVANYCCRTCKVHRNDAQYDLYEKPMLLRTKDEYESDLRGPCSETGISQFCVWNNVDFHHAYDNMVGDLLHDEEEGLLKYGMYHVVNHHVKKAAKPIPLHILNDRINTFDFYGNGLSNKPPNISDADLNREKRLKFHGSEMRNFTLAYSMLVGDLVKHDEVWTFYLIIRKIVDIVKAPKIQVEATYLLDTLVAEHHRLYIKLFKDTLKYKHHNFCHFGRIIRHSGTLSDLDSVKGERKHHEGKSVATSTRSRKNITKTVAIKQQLNLCYRLLSRRGFTPRLEIGATIIVTDIDVPLPPSFELNYLEVTWVAYNGTKYKHGLCVILNVLENGLPTFGVIDRILCDEMSNICLIYDELYTFGLDEHYHAYEVAELKSKSSVIISDLYDFHPVILARVPTGDLYVTLKYAL